MENNAKIFAKVFFPHLKVKMWRSSLDNLVRRRSSHFSLGKNRIVKIFAIPFGRAKIFTIMCFPGKINAKIFVLPSCQAKIFTFWPKCEKYKDLCSLIFFQIFTDLWNSWDIWFDFHFHNYCEFKRQETSSHSHFLLWRQCNSLKSSTWRISLNFAFC